MKISSIILTTLILLLAVSCSDGSKDFYISSTSVSFTQDNDIEERIGVNLIDSDDKPIDIDLKNLSISVTLFKKELGQDKVKIFEDKNYDFKQVIFEFNQGKEVVFLIKNEDIEYSDNIEYYEIITKATYKDEVIFSDETSMELKPNK